MQTYYISWLLESSRYPNKDILNREGYVTGTKQKFGINKLQHIMSTYYIKTYYRRLREGGKLTSEEVVKMLGICTTTVIQWYKAGLLNGYVANDKGEYLFDVPAGNLPFKRQGQKNWKPERRTLRTSLIPHMRCSMKPMPLSLPDNSGRD
jgi:hypothetical protein